MRRLVKWLGGLLLGLFLVVLFILQLGFSDPLSAAMSVDKAGVWIDGQCQSVNANGDLWRNEASGLESDSGPLEWYGTAWSALDAAQQAELSDRLKVWVADPSSQFAFSGPDAAEIEAHYRPCSEGLTYSRAAVRGDLAFVAMEYRCGFNCANGGIVALRKIGFWWFPIADLDTWIT